MKYAFGDIVVVEGDNIGVIVKTWITTKHATDSREPINYDVYVRIYNEIKEYSESEIERYMVRHKYLSDEEKQYQFNAINDL